MVLPANDYAQRRKADRNFYAKNGAPALPLYHQAYNLKAKKLHDRYKAKHAHAYAHWQATGELLKPLDKPSLHLQDDLIALFRQMKGTSHARVTLIGFVMGPQRRADLLQEMIDDAVQEKDDRLLQNCIAVGVDAHINAPLEALTDKMSETDYLQFLRNKTILLDDKTARQDKTLRAQFTQLAEKIKVLPTQKQRNALYKQLAAIHPDPKTAQELHARITTKKHSRTETPAKKQSDALAKIWHRVDARLENETPLDAQYDLSVLIGFEDMEEAVAKTHSPLVQANYLAKMANGHPVQEEKKRYHALAYQTLETAKPSKAKTKRLFALRDAAFDDDTRKQIHQTAIKQASFKELVLDIVTMCEKHDKKFTADRYVMMVLSHKEMATRKKSCTLEDKRFYESHQILARPVPGMII